MANDLHLGLTAGFLSPELQEGTWAVVSHHEDEQARKKFWDEFWEVLAPLNVFVCELKVSLSVGTENA